MKKLGFTLIELAVVILIIALISGGILASSSLSRSSQLRGVLSDIATYTQAFSNFRDKYQALPGDFAGAEALWGSESACPTTPSAGDVPHKATCNGTGDGIFDNASPETFRAWQHLADAGLISGSYTGLAGYAATPNPYLAVIGKNVPETKIPGVGFYAAIYASTIDTADFWQAMGNIFVIGTATTNGIPFGPAFTPVEAYDIDTKLDDGKPQTGKVITYKPPTFANANCMTSSSSATASYNMTYTGIACQSLYFFEKQ